MNGVLIVDKPSGLTSHDVVNRVRRILNQRSVGHLGTLDPLATGVLPLVTGNLTRIAQFYMSSEKTYEGIIHFGFATDTYDAEGEATTPAQSVTLDRSQIETLAAKFHGVIEQMPPPFSAKKINGVPAYKLARKHKEVTLQPVKVEIKEFEILSVEGGHASFRASVASGTYMRSIAHELGRELGCGAHLQSLRRTRAAEFSIESAHTLEQIEAAARRTADRNSADEDNKICHPDRSFPFPQEKESAVEGPWVTAAGESRLTDLFIHPRQLLPQLPSVTADEATAARIRNGRPVNLPDVSRAPQVKVFANQRDLIAIATRVAGTLFHPKLVFVSEPEPREATTRD
jgi:tRNA pseudouridine55 synthase